MASIKIRNGKWKVRIRKAGFAFQSRTFISHQAALALSRQVETKIEQDIACSPDKAVTLGDLLKRSKDTVTIHKKSRQDESCRIGRLLIDPLSAMRLLSMVSFLPVQNYGLLAVINFGSVACHRSGQSPAKTSGK